MDRGQLKAEAKVMLTAKAPLVSKLTGILSRRKVFS